MGHRLSRIVTRTGDKGQTSLGNGVRVEKNNPTIENLGSIDELNSWIGAVLSFAQSPEVKGAFIHVQHDLFDLGAQLSVPGTPLLSESHVSRLDETIQKLNADLSMLKEFILPGGSPSAAFAHVARTVCRRAERGLFTLSELDRGGEGLQQVHGNSFECGLSYLNRLSDLLFVVSRIENRTNGVPDVMWERGKSLGSSNQQK
ncbi:MAG: cob(I)yrinic acid a,c-diamide adenosyltransferase [Afipia sp.]|nr:cob(I)yrinic acid a,c-diamide adenosyltransferase [Afipia sp.]OJW65686.1 MAG: ATP:cob(I)alamin adenosyltransferase [Afipia sp. 64-13]